MSAKTVKVAISLPKDIMGEIESLRHKLGIARSQAILEAVSLWLKKREEETLIKKYIRGYRNKPESVKDREEALKATLIDSNRDAW